jgi:AmmeMemoRadiSam system protein B
VPLERVLLEVWAREGRIELRNVAHSEEHSLETHVPFLQKRWPGTPIVPLLTPYRDDPDAVDWLAEAWRPDVLVAVSSDLSHFHPLTEAERMDRLTEAAVEALRPEAIGPEDACGWVGMRTLLRLAARKEWQAHLLGRSHSSKVSGDARSVVGYGAWVFTEAG